MILYPLDAKERWADMMDKRLVNTSLLDAIWVSAAYLLAETILIGILIKKDSWSTTAINTGKRMPYTSYKVDRWMLNVPQISQLLYPRHTVPTVIPILKTDELWIRNIRHNLCTMYI